jgi:plasmid replication initiation protein
MRATTGLLDAPAWRTLVAEAAEHVAAASGFIPDAAPERDLGDRQALQYMREVLSELSAA